MASWQKANWQKAHWQNCKLTKWQVEKILDSRKQNIWPSMTGQKFAPMNAQHNYIQQYDIQPNDIQRKNNQMWQHNDTKHNSKVLLY